MTSLRRVILSKYLDPVSSLSEVLFGLVMTLTFTLGAGLTLQEEGREGARQLLIATIGCNLAWGMIDGVFHIVGQLYERGRRVRLGWSIQAAKSDADALALVKDELDETLEVLASTEERRFLYRRIVERVRSATIPSNRVTRGDLRGAVASFWLVFVASFPAAIPFFFIEDAWRALRVSNAQLLGLLFLAGWGWGRHATVRPWLAGLVFLIGGTALVAAAIALGG